MLMTDVFRPKQRHRRLRGRTDAVTKSARHAFTLIELLVVIAIIALLISILLPSLSAARAQAKAAACTATLHGVGNGLFAYTTAYRDWIPGVNTSGVALQALKARVHTRPELLHNKRLPVQQWDWISPILNLEGALSGNRAERFHLITEKYRCPSQQGVESQPRSNAQNGMPDREDFDAQASWTALSYLMPVNFQYWGENSTGRVLGKVFDVDAPIRAKVAQNDWEVRVISYVSRVGRVGPPAMKVLAADGTRSENPDTLEHDVTLYPPFHGSFTSSGAWWSGSNAYGVRDGSQTWDGRLAAPTSRRNGRNLSLSYRHGRRVGGRTAQSNKGSINALFFDGHVSRLNDQKSRRIQFWYPKGAIVRHGSQGMTEVADGYVIP